jgi:mannose-binding lectin 2
LIFLRYKSELIYYILKHPHPYISAMVNNGSLHYDHDKDGTHTELAGCEAQFRNRDHDTFVAVRYQNYKLTVSFLFSNKINNWNIFIFCLK